MKLRYYMRGLGIGLLVAVLILVLSGNTGKRMTDEEIKKRATQLGMVEDTKEVLSDIGKTTEPTEKPIEKQEPAKEAMQETEVEEEPVEEAVKEETPEEEPVEEITPEKPAETVSEPTEEEQKQDEIEALKKAAEEVAEKAQDINPNAIVTLLVQSGDSSVAVAKRAEAAGLVESAMDFDRFLCQNGYDKSICVGNYEVPIGATQEEIAKIITRRQ
ncbi:MAG: hypothetical protein E7299_01610 [Lachnospiraceae bacterium]|nr:hypothetical protein [Lachnospiraceae bacterium]